MTAFVPGLELNRQFFAEIIRPLLAAQFPGVAYSAGLVGYGSDVLGYDTAISTDHEWGPRLLLFLGEQQHSTLHQVMSDAFRHELPVMFRSYSTNFSAPDTSDGGVRVMEPGTEGQISHHITLITPEDFLESELCVRSADTLTARAWLTFTDQKLLEVTAGAVYYDGLGRLDPLRQRLEYYPDDVWLYRLASQWQRISQEEAFVGRCADVGDDLGSRLVAARLVREVMRLCFLLERRYAPYSKWFGSAFARLPCAEQLAPLLAATLSADTLEEREQSLAATYKTVAHMQNALTVAAPQDSASRPYHGRPYRVIHAERFAHALAAAIQDEELRHIIEDVGLVGAVDQFADSTDVLSHAGRCRRLGDFYGA